MNNLITEIERMNSLMGHKQEVLLEFRDKLRKVLITTTKGVSTLSKKGEEFSLEITKAIGKNKAEADDIVMKLAKSEVVDPKVMGDINKNFIILGSKYADDAILDLVKNDKKFIKAATTKTEEAMKKTLKANGFPDDAVNKIVDQYKKNGGKFSTKVKTPKFTPKDLKAPEEIAKYNEKIKAFQQSQAALGKNIKPGEGTRNRLAREARDEVMKLAQQATNNLSSGTKSKILDAFKKAGSGGLNVLKTLGIIKQNAQGTYVLTTTGLVIVSTIAGYSLLNIITDFMSKGVEPEPDIKNILTSDEIKKIDQQEVKKEGIRFEDEAYKRDIKVALGKSPDEAFTDEDINLIYKKFVDNNLIQTK
jgi:hypothetical protein